MQFGSEWFSAHPSDGGNEEKDGDVVYSSKAYLHHYEDKDLFGSDNEDYCKTLLKVYLPHSCIAWAFCNANDQDNGSSVRGHWQSGYQNDRGAGLLPRPGPFVTEMKLPKSEEILSRKFIALQEVGEYHSSLIAAAASTNLMPCEIACYSRVEGGDVHFDYRSLRPFKRLITEYAGADLNGGYDTFIAKKTQAQRAFTIFLLA